jgi:hypothetical protein
MENGSGTVSVTPDPSRLLIVLDVTATGASPVTVPIEQFVAAGGPVRIGPIGAAPVSRGNFDAFVGFPPGWRSYRDAANREVKIGREQPTDPIQLIIAPGAMVSVVYIVPKGGPPLTVTLPGAGAVPLVVK